LLGILIVLSGTMLCSGVEVARMLTNPGTGMKRTGKGTMNGKGMNGTGVMRGKGMKMQGKGKGGKGSSKSKVATPTTTRISPAPATASPTASPMGAPAAPTTRSSAAPAAPPTIIANCSDTQTSGGEGTTVLEIDLGVSSGTFSVTYEMYGVPDQLFIVYEGQRIFDTGGLVSGGATLNVTYSGNSTLILATISAPNSGTAWDVTIGCPYGA
jgi:hypothetical protein